MGSTMERACPECTGTPSTPTEHSRAAWRRTPAGWWSRARRLQGLPPPLGSSAAITNCDDVARGGPLGDEEIHGSHTNYAMETPTPTSGPGDCIPGLFQQMDSLTGGGMDSDFDESLAVPESLSVIDADHTDNRQDPDFLNALGGVSDKYGGLARSYVLSDRYLFLTEPKFIEALLLSTELLVKGKSYNFLHPWLGQGLITTAGPKWKQHRKFLTPAFHFNSLQNFFQVFVKNDKVLVSKLRATGKGTNLELFSTIALAALDNVTESIMGVPLNAQTDSESEYVKAIGELSDVIGTRIRNVFASVDPIFNLMPLKKVQDNAIQVLHKYARRVIETRRKELEKANITQLNNDLDDNGIKNRHAFLDLLLLAETADGKRMDDEDVREEVDTFMFAGHDTTTAGIAFILYCLSKFRDAQEKVFDEQKAIFGGDFKKDPTYSDMQQMKYLDLVIKESLRMFPPVPLIQRLITRDTVLAGIAVPKNTTCLVNIFHVHRNPALFENPMEFRPQRFENPLKNTFAWVPFSAGPRNCIGQKFAMLEIKTTVSAIVRHFKIVPSDLEDPILVADIVLRSKNGLHIKLETQ